MIILLAMWKLDVHKEEDEKDFVSWLKSLTKTIFK
jgi:hypothetical protein